MSAHETLCMKISAELNEFFYEELKLTKIKIYNDYYIIGFYEHYCDVLSSEDILTRNLDDAIMWLASKEKPLKFLYDKWQEYDDVAMSYAWDDMLNWIVELYNKEVKTNERI